MKNFMKNLSKMLDENAPTILSIMAIGGVITTGLFAANAALEAKKILEEEDEDIPKTEAIAKTWQCYIPPVVSGAITITAIIASDRINKSRILALASAYALSNENAKKYRDKVIKELGNRTDQKITDSIAKDKCKDIDTGKTTMQLNQGQIWCVEGLTGQLFPCDQATIYKAVAEINKSLNGNGWVALNDFLYDIGCRQSRIGDSIGWHSEHGAIEVNFTSCLTKDNVPCLVLNYSTLPTEVPWS